MTYADWILLAVSLLSLLLAYLRPVLRPVAGALLAYLLLVIGDLPGVWDPVRRICFAGWAGVVPVMAWGVWARAAVGLEDDVKQRGNRAAALQVGALFAVAAVAVAASREIPAVASASEATRRLVYARSYLGLRVLGLGVAAAAWRWRRPRTVAEVCTLILGASALVDVAAGVWAGGDPWSRTWWSGVALPAAAVTWGAIGATILGWTLVTWRRADR